MKKTIAILLAAATLFGLASCGPDVPDVPEFSPNVYTDIYTLTSDIFGGDFTVNVNANQAWTASSDKDWVTVTPSSGSASESAVPVTVHVAENFGAVRTATVTITLTESGLMLPQKSVTAILGVSPAPRAHRAACANCPMSGACAYRKEGTTCENQ